MLLEALIFWTSISFMLICRAIELLLVIFLISNYFKPLSQFKSAYFIFLFIGYSIDLFGCIFYLTYKVDLTNVITMVAGNGLLVLEWHDAFFAAIWNTLLACNRCTAIFFPLKQKQIWSKKVTIMPCLFLVISPLIIDDYRLPEAFSTLNRVVAFREGYLIRGMIENIILTIFILALVIFSIFNSRGQTFSLNAKIEKWLIFQALLSSIVILISYIAKYFFLNSAPNSEIYWRMYGISGIVYYLHTYCIIITHFLFSPTFRQLFFEFYWNNIFHRKKISSVAMIGAAAAGATMRG